MVEQVPNTLEQVRGWFTDNQVTPSRAYMYVALFRGFYRRKVNNILGAVDIGVVGTSTSARRDYPGRYLSFHVLQGGQNDVGQNMTEEQKREFNQLFDRQIVQYLRPGGIGVELDYVPASSLDGIVGQYPEAARTKYLGLLNKEATSVVLIPPGWSPNLRSYTLVPDNAEAYRNLQVTCLDEECQSSAPFQRFDNTEQMRGGKDATVHMTFEQIPVFRCAGCGREQQHYQALTDFYVQKDKILEDTGLRPKRQQV